MSGQIIPLRPGVQIHGGRALCIPAPIYDLVSQLLLLAQHDQKSIDFLRYYVDSYTRKLRQR